jgi:hypothetical protein
MNFEQQLLAQCPPPTGPMFGRKSEGYVARQEEARRLTKMMEAKRPFCFLRVGDGELRYLLAKQAREIGSLDERIYGDGNLSGTEMAGSPGLGPTHAERLWRAYAEADYVDYHQGNWPNEHLVKLLKLNRAAGTRNNPDKETSLLFLTWIEKEFKSYCSRRRIGFLGAEASLLQALVPSKEFMEVSKDLWPADAEVFYCQARNNGRDLDHHVDALKIDAATFCVEHKIDTLFVSLGGAAKIIAYELSRDLGMCCFDFGALTRALTYAGCDGNRFARSPHYPFLYRLPFDVHMDALEHAMPNLSPEQLLAKAHGQVIIELVRKEYGWSHGAKELDLSTENLSHFRDALKRYEDRYKRLWKVNTSARQERAKFLHFCGSHHLTWRGRVFLVWFKAKAMLAKCFAQARK